MKKYNVKEQRQIDMDLDVLSFAKNIGDDDSVFYIRTDKNNISSCYRGMSGVITNSIIDLMTKDESASNIVISAVDFYEQNGIHEIDEDGEVITQDVFEQFNLVCRAIVLMFAKKHELSFNGWVGDIVGKSAIFGKNSINFHELAYDLETEQADNVFFEWFDSDERDYITYCNDLEEDSVFCYNCESLIWNDNLNWANSQPQCPICGHNVAL